MLIKQQSEKHFSMPILYIRFMGWIFLIMLLLPGIVNFVQKRNERKKGFLMNILYSVANYIIVIAGIAAIFIIAQWHHQKQNTTRLTLIVNH